MSTLNKTLNLPQGEELEDQKAKELLAVWKDQLQRNHRDMVNAIEDMSVTNKSDIFMYLFMLE